MLIIQVCLLWKINFYYLCIFRCFKFQLKDCWQKSLTDINLSKYLFDHVIFNVGNLINYSSKSAHIWLNEDVINNCNRTSLGKPGQMVTLLNILNGSFFSLVLPKYLWTQFINYFLFWGLRWGHNFSKYPRIARRVKLIVSYRNWKHVLH